VLDGFSLLPFSLVSYGQSRPDTPVLCALNRCCDERHTFHSVLHSGKIQVLRSPFAADLCVNCAGSFTIDVRKSFNRPSTTGENSCDTLPNLSRRPAPKRPTDQSKIAPRSAFNNWLLKWSVKQRVRVSSPGFSDASTPPITTSDTQNSATRSRGACIEKCAMAVQWVAVGSN
jgi:hypothetical protein